MNFEKDPVAIYQFAQELRAKGQSGDAEQVLRKLVGMAPGYAQAHAALGEMLRSRGDDDGAVACFRAAVAAVPGYAEAQVWLGEILRSRGDDDGAVACFRAAIAAVPGYAEAHIALGQMLQSRGDDNDGAEACFRAAIAVVPGYAEGHTRLGQLLRSRGQDDEAAACFRTAARIAPDHVVAHYELGRLCAEKGWLEESFAAYDAAWRCQAGYNRELAILVGVAHRLGRDDHPAIDAIIERFDWYLKTMRPSLATPLLIWFFPHPERSGDLAAGDRPVAGYRDEAGGGYRDVVVLCQSGSPPADPDRFAAITAGATVLQVEDALFEEAASLDGGRWTRNGVTYLLRSNPTLQAELSRQS